MNGWIWAWQSYCAVNWLDQVKHKSAHDPLWRRPGCSAGSTCTRLAVPTRPQMPAQVPAQVPAQALSPLKPPPKTPLSRLLSHQAARDVPPPSIDPPWHEVVWSRRIRPPTTATGLFVPARQHWTKPARPMALQVSCASCAYMDDGTALSNRRRAINYRCGITAT
ncbi:uncharacterized protein UV8b_06708 [Ustilaginoidea virens]|uniref:Uncharacterized protein n=1 Tax=Ustilaginoidea virens TaxID=1159556 RepID=A0A8E5HVY6_USTVR|nr:uncharacterized protein UV8b_06708 [Ustilaginoidea virens]QUC22467.1 hypothetical protein UV8b_06708 [Ustilaginoidea virens]